MRAKALRVAVLIKEQRKIIKYSQQRLSNKLGLGRKGSQVISKIERSLQQIPPNYVNKLSVALMVSRADIINSMVKDYEEVLMNEVNK